MDNPGQADWYSFIGTAGEYIYIRSKAGNYVIDMGMYGPGGTIVSGAGIPDHLHIIMSHLPADCLRCACCRHSLIQRALQLQAPFAAVF